MICRASIKNRRRPSLKSVQLVDDLLANVEAIRLSGAPMSKVDLCIYKAARKGGTAWLVKIYGRQAAEFSTRAEARTFADFAPMLIAEGTCPACLTKHENLRAHIGTAECAAKREALKEAKKGAEQ
jgi:hypothetical protein